MAEAYVEERHLLKSLRWWDGFVIALCNPGFLIASLGFSMGALGTWGAVALWAISAAVRPSPQSGQIPPGIEHAQIP